MSDEIQYDPRIAAMYKAAGGSHKYRSRKRKMIGGKMRWEYEYDEPASGSPSGSAGSAKKDHHAFMAAWHEKKAYSIGRESAGGYSAQQRQQRLMNEHIAEANRHQKEGGFETLGDLSSHQRKMGILQSSFDQLNSQKQKYAKAEDPMGSNPLDLVNANPAIPSTMRQGSVTYAVAAAHELAPERSIPSLRAPARPAYEQAEREVLDLVNDLPRVNGVLTHPNGVDRRD
jgi:hypothetical protein